MRPKTKNPSCSEILNEEEKKAYSAVLTFREVHTACVYSQAVAAPWGIHARACQIAGREKLKMGCEELAYCKYLRVLLVLQ